jgi:hypothetical protein
MLFSTVLTWLLIAIGFVIALPALWLLTQALWPTKADQLRTVTERGLLKPALLGLLPLLIGILLVTVLSKLPKLGALAALTGGLLIAWGLIGASGIASLIGERLWPQHSPWQQVKFGGLTLVCCALLPVVGWFVLLPLIAVTGAGLHLRTWFLRPTPAPAAISHVETPTT